MNTSAVADPTRCQWCGNFHQFKCPLVKSIEYSEMSPALIKKVEFYAPNEFLPLDLGHLKGQSIAMEPVPGTAAAPPILEAGRHEPWPNSYNPNNTRQLG